VVAISDLLAELRSIYDCGKEVITQP
jgi:hypothetical protein